MSTTSLSPPADGVTTVFTVSEDISSNHMLVVDRVIQVLTTDYSYSGSTITLTATAVPQSGATMVLYNGTAPTFSPNNPTATPGVTTLAAMVLAAKRRADMENSEFIASDEWVNMVNASCQQLQEKLIEAYGSDYEVADSYSITTDGTSDAYSLPGDFFKLLGVDLQLSINAANGWVTVWRFNFSARNQFSLPGNLAYYGRTTLLYRLRGGKILFSPLPQANQTLRLWYAPRFIPLVADGDSVDFVNGWEEWVVNDAAMKARVKEESPVDGIAALQAVQNDRLASIADNRDASAPATTVDVYAADNYAPFGRPGGFGGGGW